MIRMNLIRNNEVTTEDVILAENAFRQDTGASKAKSTRTRPKSATNNQIKIPNELINVNQDVTLSIDGMFVNGLQFLTSISHDIYCRTSQRLPARPN